MIIEYFGPGYIYTRYICESMQDHYKAIKMAGPDVYFDEGEVPPGDEIVWDEFIGVVDYPMEMDPSLNMGIRKQVQAIDFPCYQDRNDGFTRSAFSHSKHKSSRIRKVSKPTRIKPLHKQ